MKDNQSLPNVGYMLRHYLTFNISDPISNDSRGYSNFTQYFSGENTIGQINYLERKPTTSGRFIVKVGGTTKTENTDYTLNRTTGTITWLIAQASGNDNIEAEYQAVKQWIYDDNPDSGIASWPRISVLIPNIDSEPSGQGIYSSYNSGTGELNTALVKIIVRHKKNNNTLTISNIKYKNYEAVLALAESICNFFRTNRVPRLWKFWDIQVVRNQRISTEEDTGIFRNDTELKVQYYDKTS